MRAGSKRASITVTVTCLVALLAAGCDRMTTVTTVYDASKADPNLTEAEYRDCVTAAGGDGDAVQLGPPAGSPVDVDEVEPMPVSDAQRDAMLACVTQLPASDRTVGNPTDEQLDALDAARPPL